MSKHIFFLAAYMVLSLFGKAHCEPENHEQKKIHIILYKKKGVWDSSPVRLVRNIGYYGLNIIGTLNLLEGIIPPLVLLPVEPAASIMVFVVSFPETLLRVGVPLIIAQLLKVNNEQNETAEIIADGKINDNFVIISQ